MLLATLNDESTANLLTSYLRNNGVEAQIQNANMNVMIPSIQPNEIHVSENQFGEGKRHLQAFYELHEIKTEKEQKVNYGKYFLVIILVALLYLSVVVGMKYW